MHCEPLMKFLEVIAISRRKTIAVLLTLCTVTGILSACDSGTGFRQPTKSDTVTTVAKSSVQTDPMMLRSERNAASFEKLELLSESMVTYNFVCATEPNQMNFGDMAFFKMLERYTNVHIEWENYPVLSYGDQKNLLLASNQLPDAFFGSNTLTMDDINKYGPIGVFVDLTDMIEASAPIYSRRLEESALLGGLSLAFDGKRYSFGTLIESDTRNFPDNLYINKVWLDRLGLAIPTNLDEYYDVLTAFKTGDPNRNGIADEIPLTFTKFNHITGYGSFFGAFGRIDAHNGSMVTALDHFVTENGKVVFVADKEEYKSAIKGLRRFFVDGLFDQEGFVQAQSQYQGKIQSKLPIVGSFYAWSSAAVGLVNQSQYIAIKPLKENASAPEAHVKKRLNNANVAGTGLTLCTGVKNPELLVKWIDAFYDTQMSIIAHQGPEFVIPNGDGTFSYDQTTAKDGEDYIQQISKKTPFDSVPCFVPADAYGNILPKNQSDEDKYKAIKDFYISAPCDLTLPSINFTTEEIHLNTSVGMDIQNYVKERQAKWLLGESDISTDWDGYLAQLGKYRLDAYVANLQKAYDRTIG